MTDAFLILPDSETEKPKEKPKKSKWDSLFSAVGLPLLSEIDEETPPLSITSMSIKEFRKNFKIQGRMIGSGYYPERNESWCLAGSAVLAWITGGKSNDYDYFVKSIDDAQLLANRLLNKGYKLVGYQGDEEWVERTFGKNNLPDPKNIAEWYPSPNHEENLPRSLDPLVGTTDVPEELIRALNFKKAGAKKTRQIVLLIRGNPEDVIDTFDFSISQWAMDGENIYWGKYTLQSTATKRVRINCIHHPLSTMRRMLKYAHRGYFFCSGTMLEIARGVTYFADARIAEGLDPFDQPFSID